MKKLFVLMVVLVIAVFARASSEGVFKYVGVGKCKMCHKTEKQGKQYSIWEESAHAKAYQTLAGEKAIKIAAEMKIEDPQKCDKCLSCHVTAYGAADSLKAETYSIEEGVTCEACHGPGSDYKKMKIMKDPEKAIAAGLTIADEKTCTNCHNENSPTYKKFKYDDKVVAIAHPRPEKEE